MLVFEPQEVRRIKLLRIEGYRKWKKNLFTWLSVMPSDLFAYPMYLLYYGWFS
jgi:hypothetical protein